MKPAAFLFDLDGTLVDTEELWARAIVDWLEARGQHAEFETVITRLIGHSWPDIQAALQEDYPSLPKARPDELRIYYARRAQDPTQLVISSAVDFLLKASRLAPCVIVSGSPHADVEAAMKTCGIDQVVSFVLGAEDYGRGKPAPDGFLAAASRLDVDASECVAVEDSEAGVGAARAAGMMVVGVDRNRWCRQDLSGCDWLVHDLSELDPSTMFGE